MKLPPILLALTVLLPAAHGQYGGELRFCLQGEPKTFNPLLVEDDPSEVIRYLTGGVLIRVNRSTQEIEPELAASWKLDKNGKRITFQLRPGLSFSDGTPFTADDVAETMRMVMDPKVHAPVGDAFRAGPGTAEITVLGPERVTIAFPFVVSGMERLFDQVAIMSSKSAKKEGAVLGPFYVTNYQAGSEVLLKKNPHYWKRDAQGRGLPYLDSIRLPIQQNRTMEMVRFERGELHLINNVAADNFEKLAAGNPAAISDVGPSLESELLWFNQAPGAPLPEPKRAWFRSAAFRRAILASINRDDLCRVVYHGHAVPAVGPVSPANRHWYNTGLKPVPFDRETALRMLAQDGFQMKGGVLRDRQGNVVEFSVLTNAGNLSREKMAAMIQQDLGAIGIKLNIVTLDFASLIERLTKTFAYEACLLGTANVDLDPNLQMNVWLSSASNHQWNPNQKTPATPWEAEIDRLMQAQAAERNDAQRKRYFDSVQQIAWDQMPFLYLLNKDTLIAVSPNLHNVKAALIRPYAYWNVERLSLSTQIAITPPRQARY
ncbi:MAG TPA: ABC transporter substrate-binding protein [Bryobacteraceae bacterium]|nr:ABC transporter substrate-binding protein [Bryobacteraceae bacterium]